MAQSLKMLTGISLVLMLTILGLVDAKRSKNMSVRAAGIILYRGVRPYEYLLLKANYPPHHWSPPKGHHDKNETDIQAAIRETQEESGFGLADYDLNKFFKHEMSYEAHGRNKTVIYYLAKMKHRKDPILSREHKAFKWVSLEEACELFIHQEMEDLFHTADAHLVLDIPSEELKEPTLEDFSNLPLGSSSSSSS